MSIIVDDKVRVIAGDEKGKEGSVLRILYLEDRIVVEGINYVWKHIRRSQQHTQGGRLEKEAPMSISNVQVVCTACNKPTRIGHAAVSVKVGDRMKKRRYRVCRNSGCGKPLSKHDESVSVKGKAISL